MDADNNKADTAKGRRGRPYRKGQSGNPSGRPRGARNHATQDAKAFAQMLTTDPGYRAALAQRLTAGTAGTMEPLLWHYAHGKPVERTETGGPGAFADVTTDELRARLAAALAKL